MNDLGVIHLTNGDFVVVDVDLFEELNKFKWYRDSEGYARMSTWDKTTRKSGKIRMHALINKTPPGRKNHTDHINGYECDNTRRNLRNCTYSQNMMNQKLQTRKKSSRFKGVCFHKSNRRWGAYIGSKATREYLGWYSTEMEAAEAYNTEAKKRFGEFAKLNIFLGRDLSAFSGVAGSRRQA